MLSPGCIAPNRPTASVGRGSADEGESLAGVHAFFWLNFTSDEDLQRSMGKLRSSIEDRFTEAGVSIAFPQRDVHIDASKAFRVEVVSSGVKAA